MATKRGRKVLLGVTSVVLAALGAEVVAACAQEDVQGDDIVSVPTSTTVDAGDAAAPPEHEQRVVLEAGPRPSFCNGLLFYLPFDGSYAPMVSPEDMNFIATRGTPRIDDEGHFGGAATLVVDGGDPDASAGVYYGHDGGAVRVFPTYVGSVSLWYRGYPLAKDAVAHLYAPSASAPLGKVRPSGLALARRASPHRLELFILGDEPKPLTFLSADSPNAHEGFNHVVTSWRRGDAGGETTASIRLNGGIGHAQSSVAWDIADGPSRTLRLGPSPGLNAAQAEIDDFAMWDRVLTDEEVKAIYEAGAPLGSLCPLP